MLLALSWTKIIFLNQILFSPNVSFIYIKKFIKYFYKKQFYYFFTKFNFNFIGFYENNLFKASVYWNLKNSLRGELVRNRQNFTFFFFKKLFLPIKIANVKLTCSFYKDVFFFLILHTICLWTSYYQRYKNYLNFLALSPNLPIMPAYNGYFFNIYHF
jgi:hypothetical protein